MSTRIIIGEAREQMRQLDRESVQCVVTSFPYWGLRDYGIPPVVWGGDPKCAHDFDMETVSAEIRTGLGLAELGKRYRGGGHKQGQIPNIKAERGFCRCSAWCGSFGLEPTYQLYVEHAVEVAREIFRVLKNDGTFWLNLGDCYASGAGKVGEHPGGGDQGARWKGEAPTRGYRADRLPNGRVDSRPYRGLAYAQHSGEAWPSPKDRAVRVRVLDALHPNKAMTAQQVRERVGFWTTPTIAEGLAALEADGLADRSGEAFRRAHAAQR